MTFFALIPIHNVKFTKLMHIFSQFCMRNRDRIASAPYGIEGLILPCFLYHKNTFCTYPSELLLMYKRYFPAGSLQTIP